MVGCIIKKYLDEKGIKYSYVSDGTEISKPILSAILNEKRKMSAEEYIKLCVFLNVSVSFFAEQYESQRLLNIKDTA